LRMAESKKWRMVRASYEFLREQAERGTSFSLGDLAKASGWKRKTSDIHLSKKFRGVVYETSGGKYRVDPVILRVPYEDYADLFRQSKRLFASYELETYVDVIVYDFFLPLTHEQRLRDALDTLFYRDALERILKEVGVAALAQEDVFGRRPGETDEELIQRVCERAEDVFVGYSISHVSGRFRAGDLVSRQQAAAGEAEGIPYLVDETTAVVRFIAPVTSTEDAEGLPGQLPLTQGRVREATEIRWLFLHVFAQALTRVLKQEDQVWLLESGAQSGLYVWRRVE